MTTVAETARQYDDWYDEFGFDLWGEFGEANEVDVTDESLDVSQLLAEGRIVSLVDYGSTEDSDEDFVMEGWALVDVIRRVVLPAGWKLNSPLHRFAAAEDIIYEEIAPAIGDIIRIYAPPTASMEYEEYDDYYTWAINQMRDLAMYLEAERRGSPEWSPAPPALPEPF